LAVAAPGSHPPAAKSDMQFVRRVKANDTMKSMKRAAIPTTPAISSAPLGGLGSLGEGNEDNDDEDDGVASSPAALPVPAKSDMQFVRRVKANDTMKSMKRAGPSPAFVPGALGHLQSLGEDEGSDDAGSTSTALGGLRSLSAGDEAGTVSAAKEEEQQFVRRVKANDTMKSMKRAGPTPFVATPLGGLGSLGEGDGGEEEEEVFASMGLGSLGEGDEGEEEREEEDEDARERVRREAATVKIQRLARGRHSRQRAAALRRECCAREASAVKVQALARGRRDRNRVKQLKAVAAEEDRDRKRVTKIQSLARGRQARQRVADIRHVTQAQAFLLAKQEWGAVKIQSLTRGRRDRNRVKSLRQNAAQEDTRREQSAVRIQSLSRGRRGRDRVRQLREAKDRAVAADLEGVELAADDAADATSDGVRLEPGAGVETQAELAAAGGGTLDVVRLPPGETQGQVLSDLDQANGSLVAVPSAEDVTAGVTADGAKLEPDAGVETRGLAPGHLDRRLLDELKHVIVPTSNSPVGITPEQSCTSPLMQSPLVQRLMSDALATPPDSPDQARIVSRRPHPPAAGGPGSPARPRPPSAGSPRPGSQIRGARALRLLARPASAPRPSHHLDQARSQSPSPSTAGHSQPAGHDATDAPLPGLPSPSQLHTGHPSPHPADHDGRSPPRLFPSPPARLVTPAPVAVPGAMTHVLHEETPPNSALPAIDPPRQVFARDRGGRERGALHEETPPVSANPTPRVSASGFSRGDDNYGGDGQEKGEAKEAGGVDVNTLSLSRTMPLPPSIAGLSIITSESPQPKSRPSSASSQRLFQRRHSDGGSPVSSPNAFKLEPTTLPLKSRVLEDMRLTPTRFPSSFRGVSLLPARIIPMGSLFQISSPLDLPEESTPRLEDPPPSPPRPFACKSPTLKKTVSLHGSYPGSPFSQSPEPVLPRIPLSRGKSQPDQQSLVAARLNMGPFEKPKPFVDQTVTRLRVKMSACLECQQRALERKGAKGNAAWPPKLENVRGLPKVNEDIDPLDASFAETSRKLWTPQSPRKPHPSTSKQRKLAKTWAGDGAKRRKANVFLTPTGSMLSH